MVKEKLHDSSRSSLDGSYRLLRIGHFNILYDALDEPLIQSYSWRVRRSNHCFYAMARSNGRSKYRELKMHRLIAQTPAYMVCHHRNRNTLDNRRSNLLNLSQYDHDRIYRTRREPGFKHGTPTSQ